MVIIADVAAQHLDIFENDIVCQVNTNLVN